MRPVQQCGLTSKSTNGASAESHRRASCPAGGSLIGPVAQLRSHLEWTQVLRWIDPKLPKFGEDAHRSNAEVGPLGQPHGLVEGTLPWLVIRDEHRLAYVFVSL